MSNATRWQLAFLLTRLFVAAILTARFAYETTLMVASASTTPIVAKRLVDHLERAGFVVMKRLPEIGAGALGRGFGE